MTCRLHNAPSVYDIESSTDKDGNRTFKVVFLVDCDRGDGPETARQTPGLPQPGDAYSYGTDGYTFAWCYWADEVKAHSKSNEAITQYAVTKTFSTKPEDTQHCRERAVEDPLSELPKISGSYSKYTEEAVFDRFGKAVTYSSFERIRGAQNEWDKNRLSVKIQQNVSSFYLGVQLPALFLDCVNAFPLWGLPPRTIKLSTAPWEKKYYGRCVPYYTRTLDFDIRYTINEQGVVETWDRYILDESSKVLSGDWVGSGSSLTYVPKLVVSGVTITPNAKDPSHYIKCSDVRGNLQKMILNGAGVPANVLTTFSGSLFVSLANANVGNAIDNIAFWLQILDSDPTNPDAWDATIQYVQGNLVKRGGSNYVAINDNINSAPPSFNWTLLSNPLTSKGAWNVATSYSLGDYVTPVGYSGAAGYIFVSKYVGVDFSQLGIPVTL